MLRSELESYDFERVAGRFRLYRRRGDGQVVAVKTFFAEPSMQKGRQEARILSYLASKEDHNHYIVRIFERLPDDVQFHIVQECLDGTLQDFKNIYSVKKFKTRQIRVVLRQVLTALSRMKEVGIVHSRIQMKNLMLVDHVRQPFRVKLIGFSDALERLQYYCDFMYRTPISVISAPEEILGCPCSSKTDLWSVGCMAAKMALGRSLFPAESHLELAHHIFGTRGLPPAAMLDSGVKTKYLFDRVACENGTHGWQLKPWRRNLTQRIRSWMGQGPANLKDLEAKSWLGCFSRRQSLAELEDRRCLSHLINCLLAVDPEQRVDADQALHHPFFTLQHLRDPAYETYYNRSRQAYQDAGVSVPQDLPPGSCDLFEEIVRQRRPSLRRRLRSFFARRFIRGRRERPAAAPGDEGPLEATSSTADAENLSTSASGPAAQSNNRDEEIIAQRRRPSLRRRLRSFFARRFIRGRRERPAAAPGDEGPLEATSSTADAENLSTNASGPAAQSNNRDEEIIAQRRRPSLRRRLRSFFARRFIRGRRERPAAAPGDEGPLEATSSTADAENLSTNASGPAAQSNNRDEEIIAQRRRPSLRRRLRSFFARRFIRGRRERPAAAPGDEGPLEATSSTADAENLSTSASGPAAQSNNRDEEIIAQRRRPSLRRRLRSFFARRFIRGRRERPAAAPGDEGPLEATSSTADAENLSTSASGPAAQSNNRDEQGSADEGQCSSLDEPQTGSDSSTGGGPCGAPTEESWLPEEVDPEGLGQKVRSDSRHQQPVDL